MEKCELLKQAECWAI